MFSVYIVVGLFVDYLDVVHKCTFLFQVEGSSEAAEKVKKSISNVLGVITDTLAPPPDKTIDCDVITLVATPTGTTEVYDSSKVRSSRLYSKALSIYRNNIHKGDEAAVNVSNMFLWS